MKCFLAFLFPICFLGADGPPTHYTLDYPTAKKLCPPVRSFFTDVSVTVQRVRGRTIRHAPKGGYGLPVQDKIDDKHLIHLGADVGWYQVGEPVFAVADGVVRISEGPSPKMKSQERRPPRSSMAWGNLIVLEHRLPDEAYVTTIYGHLGVDRRVAVGDVVHAGQQIGSIGRQNRQVNGGYKPHLHFGVRQGRVAEPGAVLFTAVVAGERVPVRIGRISQDLVELEGAEKLPNEFKVKIGGSTYDVVRHDGTTRIAARLLWDYHRADFPIVGYGLSSKSWYDPTDFLKRHRADIDPAPFHRTTYRRLGHRRDRRPTDHEADQLLPEGDKRR